MRNFFTFLYIILFVNIIAAQQKPEIIPGNLIVQVTDGNIDKVVADNQYFNGLATGLKLDRLLSAPMAAYLLQFDPDIDHNRFLQQVWDHPSVSLVQFNHVIYDRNTTPDDPQLSQQWWHVNTGGGGGTADADIDSDEAWDITTGGVTAIGDTIVVCVVDDGGDLSHPDLAANMWVNYNEIPDNNIDDDNNGYVDDYLGWNPVNHNDNVDGGGHGVNVAGMIGAVGNNGTGVVGVNWHVKIMTMTYGSINQEANVVEAYTYPLVMRRLYESTSGAKGAFVVATNSSWGIDNGSPTDAPLWCAFYDTLGAAGILSAGATANNNVDIDVVGDLPTGCPSEFLLSVTATNNNDVRTFSGYGQTTVDLGAPGEDVRTTASGNGYTTTSGTSFASPATAGAIALVYSAPCASLAAIAHADPPLAAQMVRDAIFAGVDPISNLNDECVTGGRLNTKGALDQILSNCSTGGCLAPFSLTASSVTGDAATISWGFMASIDTFNIAYGQVGQSGTGFPDLTPSQYSLAGLDNCSDYWFQAQSVCDGQPSDWSDSLFFSTDGCCEPPSGLVLSDITDSTATASWNAVLAADSYLLQWRVAGAGQWGQTDSINALTYSIPGLGPCTDYEVRIATNCNNTATGFTAVETFTTFGCGSCTDLSFCTSSGLVEFEWIGEVSVDVLHNSTDGSIGGYADYTGISVDLQRGQTYPVSFSPGFSGASYTEHFRVWIDLDQNGTFGTDEMLFDDDQGTQNSVSDSITIPLTAELGSARMRISMAYGTQFGDYPQGPCDVGQDGEVEDYCASILAEDPDGIGQPEALSAIEVYPVPASSTLTVQLPDNATHAALLIITDTRGRTVAKLPALGMASQQLDISGLSDGVYMLEMRTSNARTVARKRFIKD